MVLGKLLILAATSPVAAGTINDPKFFEYRGGSFVNELVYLTFGWFKTLSIEQKDSYNQALTHAIMFAENGDRVEWYKNDASGYSVPVMTWPTGSGYCRRVHVQAIAYNTERNMSATACYDNSTGSWRWIRE